MKVPESLSRRRTRWMLHPLEIVMFALMFSAALLPHPWAWVPLSILLVSGTAFGVYWIASEIRAWLTRRQLRRASWL
jgi:hypothetical protein